MRPTGVVSLGNLGGIGFDLMPAILHHAISPTRAAAAFLSVIGGPGLLRGEQDEKRASIRIRKCRRMRDGGRA